ncbi:MAG: universal stress protein [Thiomargarita sp.]|nr:universal stress protein [Thiomargarita sp.]
MNIKLAPINSILFILALFLTSNFSQADTTTLSAEISHTNQLIFTPLHPNVNTKEKLRLEILGTTGKLTWVATHGKIVGSGSKITYIAPEQSHEEIITVTDETGNKASLIFKINSFPKLQLKQVLFLLFIGFIAGLVSGFIGSSGAFILTPAMIAMGIPPIIAVASNICHKFPRASIGVLKRAKSGAIDIKLSFIMGGSAAIGIWYGIKLQTQIKDTFGNLGSGLYVAIIFVTVLVIVGIYYIYAAIKAYNQHDNDIQTEKTSKIANWLQSINIPGTMVYLPSLGNRISVLFIIPLGLITGLLTASIAVGSFFGTPAMIYILGVPILMATATELLIAFIMGLVGTIQYAINGFVDIRLAMIILAGSLFGIQLGIISATYAKNYLSKAVISSLMLLILINQGFKIPVYLSDLGKISPLSESVISVLNQISFISLILALVVGLVVILYAFVQAYRYLITDNQTEIIPAEEEEEYYPTSITQLSPTKRFEKILLVSDRSKFSLGAEKEAIKLVQKIEGHLYAMSVVVTNAEHESLVRQIFEKENKDAHTHLEKLKIKAEDAGINCDINVCHGVKIYHEIIEEAERKKVDLVVMGRRGYTGLKRVMIGSNTAKVIGHSYCNVLVVPESVQIQNKKILVAIDGSRYGDIAANATIKIARHLNAPILLVCVLQHTEELREGQHIEAVKLIKRTESFMNQEGNFSIETKILSGNPAQSILEIAEVKQVNLIIVGSHGRTGLDKVIMGSVSDYIISYAKCAVLVAKT